MTTVELVLQYLRNLREQGVDCLPVDEEARAILREWMLAARRGIQKPVAASPFPSPPIPTAEGISALRSALQETSTQPEQAIAPVSPEEEVPFFRPGGASDEEIWENMERMLPGWRPLRELGTLRSTAVLGEGNRHADIMFVGDAPNYFDEKSGRPFSSDAGEKLDGILKAMELTREQVYTTHLVKFRPSLPRQTTNNRAPSDKEMRFSSSVVELEARLVQPRVIIALGIIAARGLLQRGDLPLADYRREGGCFCGIPVIVTHHPSYLLRTNDLDERRQMWEEMLRAMELAGLPISAKQRAFFTKK
ncbi:MAG: uracil-DNA glycosylase [Akkermansia sp.]|nr:uracil-DNA glycosylase [Akkermansia sp.]